MRPKGKHPATGDLFQQPLAEIDQSQAPAGETGRVDRLVSLRNPLGGILFFPYRAPGQFVAIDRGVALPATHVCLLG